jgi:flavin reductase (DIM6/NTAB) family NADH-FMN oxidoreductase RutF
MAKIEVGPSHYMFPMPAVLVGANVHDKPNYLTAAWCGTMQGQPPLIYAALNRIRYTLYGIRVNESFSINIPSTSQVREVDYCGTTSGHEHDKSKIFSTFYGSLGTAPMIDECPINLECRLLQILDFDGSHEICVGVVVQTFVKEEILTNNEPDIKKVDPLIYSTGDHNYYNVGEQIAKGFDVGKDYVTGSEEE